VRITLPFVYETTYRASGRDKPSTTLASDVVGADVPELGKSDVRLAASWKGRWDEAVVAWNGDLYRNVAPAREGGLKPEALLEPATLTGVDDIDCLNRVYGYPYWGGNLGKLLKKAFGGELSRPSCPRGSEILSSTLDRDRHAAQFMANGLLVIDGGLWHRIPGIVFYLHKNPGYLSIGPRPYGSLKSGLLYGLQGIQNPTVDYILGIQHAEVAEERPAAIQSGFSDLEVHLPDLVACDGHLELAARTMNFAIRTGDRDVGSLSREDIGLWLRMRETVRGWYGDPPVPFREDGLEAFAALCGRLPDPDQFICKGWDMVADSRAWTSPAVNLSTRPAPR